MLREPRIPEDDRANGRHRSYIIACVGKDPCVTVESADTAVEVGDDEFWMLMAGRSSPRVTAGCSPRWPSGPTLIGRRELTDEASRTAAIVKADELRRSLLSAVSPDLRRRWRPPRSPCRACAPEDIAFSPDDTAELLATIEESIDQFTALIGRPARFVATGRRSGAPTLCQSPWRIVQRALVGLGNGATSSDRSAIDRVIMDVSVAVMMAVKGYWSE